MEWQSRVVSSLLPESSAAVQLRGMHSRAHTGARAGRLPVGLPACLPACHLPAALPVCPTCVQRGPGPSIPDACSTISGSSRRGRLVKPSWAAAAQWAATHACCTGGGMGGAGLLCRGSSSAHCTSCCRPRCSLRSTGDCPAICLATPICLPSDQARLAALLCFASSGKADDWVDEIPTVIVPPAPAQFEKILQARWAEQAAAWARPPAVNAQPASCQRVDIVRAGVEHTHARPKAATGYIFHRRGSLSCTAPLLSRTGWRPTSSQLGLCCSRPAWQWGRPRHHNAKGDSREAPLPAAVWHRSAAPALPCKSSGMGAHAQAMTARLISCVASSGFLIREPSTAALIRNSEEAAKLMRCASKACAGALPATGQPAMQGACSPRQLQSPEIAMLRTTGKFHGPRTRLFPPPNKRPTAPCLQKNTCGWQSQTTYSCRRHRFGPRQTGAALPCLPAPGPHTMPHGTVPPSALQRRVDCVHRPAPNRPSSCQAVRIRVAFSVQACCLPLQLHESKATREVDPTVKSKERVY